MPKSEDTSNLEKTSQDREKVKETNSSKDNRYFNEIEKSKIAKKINNDRNKDIDTKHPFINAFIIVTIVLSLINFIVSIVVRDSSASLIINSGIMCLFSILYLYVCLTYNKKNKKVMLFSAIILFVFFLFNINSSLNIVSSPITEVANLSGKTVTEAIKWANKNNVKITQEYEFSDSVPEYSIIGQSIKAGTNLDEVDEIVLTISEGPNPYKEIIVPSMISWDTERVINFVLSNYLTNVVVEFVESDKVKDTVIEQNKSGNLLRNEELKITFSYGDEGNSDVAKLIDFKDKSQFEIEFFMKQNHVNYKFEYEFSDKIRRGNGLKQSVNAGEEVKVSKEELGDEVVVTISKGSKIKVPKVDDMDITAITEWAVKNKLKLEFSDTYDEKVKEGKIVKIDKDVGSIIEQGTTIKVTLSLGSLKMPKFKEQAEFYTWADKYGIKYEVVHEFNESVEAGKIISFSRKNGQALKNDEVITLTVSDGVKRSVPNVVGLTKSQASSKLKDAGLNYNFVYRNNSASRDKVLAQSISAGSDVPDGTTITITLSTGTTGSSSNSSGSSNSGGSNNSGNSSNNNSSGNQQPVKPVCDTSKGANVWFMAGSTGADTYSMTKNQNPGFTFTINYVDSCPNGNTSSGTLCSKSVEDGAWVSYCTTINMTVVK